MVDGRLWLFAAFVASVAIVATVTIVAIVTIVAFVAFVALHSDGMAHSCIRLVGNADDTGAFRIYQVYSATLRNHIVLASIRIRHMF